MNIMNFNDLLDQVNDDVKDYLDTMELTPANRLGLDPRAGHELFVNEYGIAVFFRDEIKLKYYGGFEYINDDDRTQLGDYVFYSNRATRVSECLDFYLSECEYGNEL
jgi:hypothetical protein